MKTSRPFIVILLIISALSVLAPKNTQAQSYSVKTNIPAMLTTNLNVAFEMSVSKHFSLEFPIYVNPLQYSDRYSALFGMIQPGVRYWLSECYRGAFVGVQSGFGKGEVSFQGVDRKGKMSSVGASFGYTFMLGVRWNLEAEMGFGHYWLDYKVKKQNRNWPNDYTSKKIWAPTRLGVNFAYLF